MCIRDRINTVCDFASTGKATSELANSLKQHGYECKIAYSEIFQENNGDYKIGRKLGKKVHALFARIFGLQAYYSKLSTYAVLHYLSIEKPDVVQLGNLHSNYININSLLRFLAKKDIATVITLHDCWFYTGKCLSLIHIFSGNKYFYVLCASAYLPIDLKMLKVETDTYKWGYFPKFIPYDIQQLMQHKSKMCIRDSYYSFV